jgi:ATP-dependent Lhr-like helicase
MRFLLHWQHVAGDQQVQGVEGLIAVIEQLDGYEVAAGAWEHDVLPARVRDYGAEQIDMLCLSGRVAWGRLTPVDGMGKAPLKSSPIALMLREHAARWRVAEQINPEALSSEARAVLDALRARGASFFHELAAATGMLPTLVERALGELAGLGLATADSFSGLRALLTPPEKRKSLSGARSKRRAAADGVDTAGRWALLAGGGNEEERGDNGVPARTLRRDEERIESVARTLLRRYGVVFRALLARESRLPAWRELAMAYRRLEARGEIRGGRFVAGYGGEQFAAPDAVGRLRAVRKLDKSGELIALCGADPLNLVGIVTPGARIPAIARNRVLFRDGFAIAALEGGEVRRLADSELEDETLRTLLARRSPLRPLKPYLRVPTRRELTLLAQRRSGRTEQVNPT